MKTTTTTRRSRKQKRVRFSIDLDPQDYRLLCREWTRRQDERECERVFLRDIVIDALHEYLPQAQR